jgi:hypothetical protein
VDAVPTATSGTTTSQFLIDRLGEEYFRNHYSLVHEEDIADGLVKALYHYTNEPYVQDYPFTFFLDIERQKLSDLEVSVVLLEPQVFKIGPEQAKTIALENGLDPTGGAYEVNLVFGLFTHNRFAWEVANLEATQGAEAPDPIARVVLDVEGGHVYAIDTGGPMESD